MARVRPIEVVPIEKIKKDPNNAYQHADADIARLYGVIDSYGFLGALAVDEDYVLIGGEARLEVLTQMDHREVPVNVVEGLTPDERTALAIALNASFGTWNQDRLRGQLLNLKRNDFDLDFTGLPPFQVESTLDLSKKKDDDKQRGPGQTGPQVLSHQLVFENEIEQTAWLQYCRWLKTKYPDRPTVAARITALVADMENNDDSQ